MPRAKSEAVAQSNGMPFMVTWTPQGDNASQQSLKVGSASGAINAAIAQMKTYAMNVSIFSKNGGDWEYDSPRTQAAIKRLTGSTNTHAANLLLQLNEYTKVLEKQSRTSAGANQETITEWLEQVRLCAVSLGLELTQL